MVGNIHNDKLNILYFPLKFQVYCHRGLFLILLSYWNLISAASMDILFHNSNIAI